MPIVERSNSTPPSPAQSTTSECPVRPLVASLSVDVFLTLSLSRSGLNIGIFKEAAEHLLSALSLHERSSTSDQSTQAGGLTNRNEAVNQSLNLWATLRRAFYSMVSRHFTFPPSNHLSLPADLASALALLVGSTRLGGESGRGRESGAVQWRVRVLAGCPPPPHMLLSCLTVHSPYSSILAGQAVSSTLAMGRSLQATCQISNPRPLVRPLHLLIFFSFNNSAMHDPPLSLTLICSLLNVVLRAQVKLRGTRR